MSACCGQAAGCAEHAGLHPWCSCCCCHRCLCCAARGWCCCCRPTSGSTRRWTQRSRRCSRCTARMQQQARPHAAACSSCRTHQAPPCMWPLTRAHWRRRCRAPRASLSPQGTQAQLPPFPDVLQQLAKAGWNSLRELLTALTRSEIKHAISRHASRRSAWKLLKDPRCAGGASRGGAGAAGRAGQGRGAGGLVMLCVAAACCRPVMSGRAGEQLCNTCLCPSLPRLTHARARRCRRPLLSTLAGRASRARQLSTRPPPPGSCCHGTAARCCARRCPCMAPS